MFLLLNRKRKQYLLLRRVAKIDAKYYMNKLKALSLFVCILFALKNKRNDFPR